MRKENQGLTEAGEFGRVPGFFVVHFSFFVVPGRGVLNTPHKTTRQGRIQGDGKGQIFTVRHIQHGVRGRRPLTPTSFSCLDTRKGCEKKIKASGMPANLPCPGRGPHRGRGIWPGTGKGHQGCRPIWPGTRLFRCSFFVFRCPG